MVVGTQIKGSKMTEALPVTVIGKNTIASTAAVSGDELFRSIPQMGSITFNSQSLPGNVSSLPPVSLVSSYYKHTQKVDVISSSSYTPVSDSLFL